MSLPIWGAALILLSCGGGFPGGGQRFEIERDYGRGMAVELTVRVSKTRISTAEKLVLVVQTRAADSWNVAFPEISETLGQLAVVDRSQESRTLGRHRELVSTRRYTLQPFLPGRYAIPPLEITFGESGAGYPFALSSEEIPIEVSSVMPPQLGPQEIEEIAGPLSLPSSRFLWLGLGGFLLAAGGAGAFYLRRRQATHRPAAAKGPGETALEELELLLAGDLLAQERHREFYEAISGLTRRYLERRFSIRAPELTTEEFLQEARGSEALSGYRQQLQEFLSHCDLVKFARHRPTAEEAENTVAACRGFIAATAPKGRES